MPSSSISFSLLIPISLALLASACISDPDCGICDPERLVLESFGGPNYADRTVRRLTPGVERGQVFVTDIVDCLESEDASGEAAQRGPEEWCKISPLVTVDGLELVFNNLLDPTSIELVRKQPQDPLAFEVYDWKTQLAHVEGPITRFDADFWDAPNDAADVVTRAVNLSCIDNLRAQGIAVDAAALEAGACAGFHVDAQGRRWPLEMQLEGRVESFRGETDWRAGECSTPPDGPDTCCNVCDWELGVHVAKYGLVGPGGERRSDVDALACSLDGDPYRECEAFVPEVDRSFETNRYAYEWLGELDTWRLPLSDKLRETHPDARPSEHEPIGASCSEDADCVVHGEDAGLACIGETASGEACTPGTPECGEGRCRPEWFVTCSAGPSGAGTCVDRRFRDRGAAACYVATAAFQRCDPATGECTQIEAGNRLARADATLDGLISPAEGCQAGLGGGVGCDPLFQPSVVALPRFDRDGAMPDEVRGCFCGPLDQQDPACAKLVTAGCSAPYGTLERAEGEVDAGAYATRLVTKRGGVIYDPALKGVLWLPADRGNQPRSFVEACAEVASPDQIEGRGILDGWRMHEGSPLGVRDYFEGYEDFDRALCSGSSYTLVFADAGERVRDKLGNQLDVLRYEFETPEFHVIPGSGFPTDNLRIGACQRFEINLSNKYDLDPRNLRKLELWSLEPIAGTDAQGVDCALSPEPACWDPLERIAGGSDCSEVPVEVAAGASPCLTVDVGGQAGGHIGVELDTVRFGARLEDASAGGHGRYRLRVPGLEQVESFAALDLDDAADLAAYEAAFHDVCGMPLIAGGGQGYVDHLYDFTVDEPKCKEDEDGDGIPFSCDNDDVYPNAEQEDQDFDGNGDVGDLCVFSPSSNNTSDSDRDGFGNACDACSKAADSYQVAMLADARYWVRQLAWQGDSDGDGIGDGCDNCIAVANCENEATCQLDLDQDMIGDACDVDAGAAMIAGFTDDEDFDGDGLRNADDTCPRVPVVAQACSDASECGLGRTCIDGLCSHRDCDRLEAGACIGDTVGDACDSCPFEPNPFQIGPDGAAQNDDLDLDGVGNACETDSACEERQDPRPHAYFAEAAEGLCCTTLYPGDGWYDAAGECQGLCDPDGFAITLDCAVDADPDEEQPGPGKCRMLPETVIQRAGVIALPLGCSGEAEPLELDTLAQLPHPEAAACLLPQWDQDFDGIGDACDLCPYAFDPSNRSYVDPVSGKSYPSQGHYCNGDYAPDAPGMCDPGDPDPGAETDTESGG